MVLLTGGIPMVIKKASLMEVLPCKFPNVKSGIKNVSAGSNNHLNNVMATPQ